MASLDMENFMCAICIGIESGYSYISVWCYMLGKYSLRDKNCDRDRHKHDWERRWDRLSERERLGDPRK